MSLLTLPHGISLARRGGGWPLASCGLVWPVHASSFTQTWHHPGLTLTWPGREAAGESSALSSQEQAFRHHVARRHQAGFGLGHALLTGNLWPMTGPLAYLFGLAHGLAYNLLSQLNVNHIF